MKIIATKCPPDDVQPLPETSLFHAFRRSEWLTGTLVAICDQGVWSLANFVFSLYLVRRLGLHQFGVYSVAFSVYLIFAAAQNSLLLEPMSVVSAAAASRKEGTWKETAVRIQTRLGLLGTVFLSVAAVVAYRMRLEFAPSLIALAAGFPVMGAVALQRRFAYMENAPLRSVMAGLANLFSVFLGAAGFNHLGLLTPAIAFLILGLASIPALLSLSTRNLFRIRASSAMLGVGIRESWDALWLYGRWSAAAAASGVLGSVLFPPLLAAISSYDAAGLYRSMEYLFLPAAQALTAVTYFSITNFSVRFNRAGLLASLRHCFRYVATLGGAAILYAALAFFFFAPVARKLLGADSVAATWMIAFFGFILMMRALGDSGIGVILRALHRPNAVFIANVLNAVVIAGIAYPLCRMYGMAGLLYGNCIAWTVQTTAYAAYLVREIRLAKSASTCPNPSGPLDLQNICP